MLDIILNEEKVVNDFKSDYILPDNLKMTDVIKLLVKYYYLLSYDQDKIYKSIMDDIKNSLKKDFVYTNWNNTVRSQIKYFYKTVNTYKLNVVLYNIKEINITQNELNEIRNLDDLILEKIAFICLVYAKISMIQMQNNHCWINKTTTTICKEAKVGLRSIEKTRIFNKLYESGYIYTNNDNTNTNMKVCFADKDKREDDLIIVDFDGVVYQYLNWRGENWIRCQGEGCNKWVKPKSNRKKYCPSCWKEKEKEDNRRYARESMRKIRKNRQS